MDDERAINPDSGRWAAEILVLAGTYFVLASVGISVAFQNKFISLVWPPSGLAIAVIYLAGFRLLPGVYLGAFLINYSVAHSVPVALGIAAGNTMEAFVGASLLHLFGFRRELDRIRDVIVLVALGAWLASLVSATVGTFTLFAAARLTLADLAAAWLRWWMGDVIGICVLSPVCFVLARRTRLSLPWRRAGEAASLGILLVTMHFAFSGSGAPYLIFPVLFWAATRFGPSGAALSTFVVSAGTVWYTLRGIGPFAHFLPEQNLLAAQSFIGVETVTGLAVAAALCEYREREQQRVKLAEAAAVEDRLHFLSDASDILGATLRYDDTLANITRMLVPRFADYCVIARRDRDGKITYVKAAHRDPVMERNVIPKLVRQNPNPAKGHPVGLAMFEGRSSLTKTVTDEMLREIASDEEHLSLLRTIHPVSYIAAPMISRIEKQLLGALICARTEDSGLHYDEADLALAEDLARRCAAAIERAELYASAQEAIRLRQDTLAVVSHDLRNPLSAIVLSAQLLERLIGAPAGAAAPAPQARSVVRRLIESAERCKRLVESLLKTAKIESGLFVARKEWVSARSTVGEAISELVPLAASKGVDLRLELPDQLGELYCDRTEVYQLISNIVGNALKFTPKSGRITLSAEESGKETLFAVRDTGPGIAPELLAHIFDRYWQPGRRGREGAGLGLTIARGIVLAHGGRIWIESTPGQGTTVHFTLPRAPKPVERARPGAA